jgi:hypothetical protein
MSEHSGPECGGRFADSRSAERRLPAMHARTRIRSESDVVKEAIAHVFLHWREINFARSRRTSNPVVKFDDGGSLRIHAVEQSGPPRPISSDSSNKTAGLSTNEAGGNQEGNEP